MVSITLIASNLPLAEPRTKDDIKIVNERALPLPDRTVDADRRAWPAIKRGAARKCPRCGAKSLFAGYTRIADECAACGQDFSGHRADDAPPYLTMMIVGHALAIPMVETVRHLDLAVGLQLLIWIPIALAMTLWLLPVTKGGLIAFQWAQRMHGFGTDSAKSDSDPSLTS